MSKKVKPKGLILTRGAGESICAIHDGMVVHFILDYVRGNRASVRIVAPDAVRILRGELPDAPNVMEISR